jgi:dipeptidyl aminopeptidase/acylaminoacyl peptidase
MNTRAFGTHLSLLVLLVSTCCFAADKPKLTLDEAFNSVDYTALQLSPDGHSLVIGTVRADWDQNIFSKNLWIYRDDGKAPGTLTQLTQSGHDSDPQWSPDGKWIAFLSERKQPKGDDESDDKDKDDEVSQLFLISPNGGEAFAVTQGDEEVHAFSWSADSRTLYFATRTPWTKAQQDAYKKEWKDTNQYRASERGDQIFKLDVAEAIGRHAAAGSAPPKDEEQEKNFAGTEGATAIAKTPWRVEQMATSLDGRKLAFVTTSISQRNEKVSEYEIFAVDLANASLENAPRQLTKNEATEGSIRWANDNRHLFFDIQIGSVEKKYEDTQPRIYWVDSETAQVQRWAPSFEGATGNYTVTSDGKLLAAARLGTEVQVYSAGQPAASLAKVAGWAGTYDRVASALHSPQVAVVYSSYDKPTEVYIADSAEKLSDARPVTSFNKLFTERDLPKAKPYQWVSDDGTKVEGMLVYPPGRFEAKNLPMFTLIHGGPADADGNAFETDWYKWDRLAATQGWLVFQPNYRGSSGYGDKFLMGIVPEIVSRPGKDILAGVDALVKDGIADPNRLTVGGYSYGGYMTNWLITQTTRFKAAVTGAGAVENVGNWGNDDTTFDDAYFLGGLPWEAQQRYHDEAAIFQINKVKTPTHMVGGANDIRVAVLEDYLLDRALHELGVPSTLLIFPGEGHSLSKNPWHGKIKVREELKWLQKYGGQ